MTREELVALGLEKDAIDKIMVLHGKDLTETKKKLTETEGELTKVKVKVDTLTTDLTTTKDEFEEFKTSKMSDDEKQKKIIEDAKKERQKVIDDAKAEAEKYRKLSIVANVKSIFGAAGLVEDDYKSILGGLENQNEDVAVNMANSFVTVINSQKEIAAKKAIEEGVKKTPSPKVNENNNTDEPYKVPLVF